MRRSLLDRFPDSAAVLRAVFRDLRREGELALQTELAEAFLARRPDDREAYGLAFGTYSAQGDAAAAREVLEAWLERFPGDPEALRNRLAERRLERPSPAQARSLAADTAARLDPGPGAAQVCDELSRLADGAALEEAARCYEKLLAAAEGGEHGESLVFGFARLAARRGDWESVSAALAALPAERRETGLGTVIAALARDGRCATAASFGRELAAVHTRSDSLSNAVRALGECARDAEVQALFLHFVESVPGDELSRVIPSSELLEIPGLEPALRRRLERDPGSYETWEALDRYYEKSGREERRIEHLTAWLEAHSGYRGTERHRKLTDLLLAHGRNEEAIAALDAASRTPGSADDLALTERLVDLLLVAGRSEEAEAAARRLIAGGGRSAHEGRRLLARPGIARQAIFPSRYFLAESGNL